MSARRARAVFWVRLAMAGSLLMALCAFLGLVHVPLLPSHGYGFWMCVWAYRLRVVVYFIPFALGLGLLVWAEKRFKQGYRNDLWSEGELAEVRNLAAWKVWAWIGLGTIALWIMSLLWLHSTRGAAVWYALMVPGQTAQRIRQLVTPRVKQISGLGDWRNFGALRSEHWGQRNA